MKDLKISIQNVIILLKIMGKNQIVGLIVRSFSHATNILLTFLLIYYQRIMIESIQNDNTTDKVLLFAVLSVVSVTFMQRIFDVIFGYISLTLNNKLSYKLEYTKHNKCVNVQLLAYDNHEIYDKMSIADRMGTTIITEYIVTFFNIATVTVQFISSAIMLSAYSIWLLLAAFLGAVPVIIVRKFDNLYEQFDKKRISIIRRKNYFKKMASDGEHTKEIKLFGIISYICGEHKRYHDEWAKGELQYRDKDNRRRLIWQPIISLFIMVLPTLFLIWRVSLKEIDIAGFIYYLSLLSLCHDNLTSMVNYYFDNKLADSRIKDYFDFLNIPIDSREGADIPSEWLKEIPEIEFRNVSFKYCGSELNAIDNVSFVIKPNEKIALLGLNGAGKTTLIKLLCGLYEPTKGEILIGGHNIMEFSQLSLYRLFSVVFQDFINYELPLVESLSLGGKKASTESIKQALKNVDGIELLEKRFRGDVNRFVGKKIDKDGLELSGGEHQKIVLARALLQDRSMLILDEPTSNLDVYAESAIMRQFLVNIKNRSIIIVSHRLSSALFVDRIIVMENGRIIEQGVHSELIKRNGKYAYLFNLQLSQFK